MAELTPQQQQALTKARNFYLGHDGAVGVLQAEGIPDMLLKSGVEGGPYGGSQRGGVPRGPGWGFTQGGPSQGNISTHVEGHAAAIMWQRNLKTATLIVDRGMCGICARDLSAALPPGSTLIVISESEGLTIVSSSHALTEPSPPVSKTAAIISSRSRFARMGRVAGLTIFDVVLSLILDLIAAKFMESLDRKKFEKELRALEPKMNEKKREAYLAFMRKFGSQELGSLYYNVKIMVTATTIVVIAGSGSRNIPVLNLDVLSVVITDSDINIGGNVYEKSETASQKFGAAHPVIFYTLTQFPTYSQPVKPL